LTSASKKSAILLCGAATVVGVVAYLLLRSSSSKKNDDDNDNDDVSGKVVAARNIPMIERKGDITSSVGVVNSREGKKEEAVVLEKITPTMTSINADSSAQEKYNNKNIDDDDNNDIQNTLTSTANYTKGIPIASRSLKISIEKKATEASDGPELVDNKEQKIPDSQKKNAVGSENDIASKNKNSKPKKQKWLDRLAKKGNKKINKKDEKLSKDEDKHENNDRKDERRSLSTKSLHTDISSAKYENKSEVKKIEKFLSPPPIGVKAVSQIESETEIDYVTPSVNDVNNGANKIEKREEEVSIPTTTKEADVVPPPPVDDFVSEEKEDENPSGETITSNSPDKKYFSSLPIDVVDDATWQIVTKKEKSSSTSSKNNSEKVIPLSQVNDNVFPEKKEEPVVDEDTATLNSLTQTVPANESITKQ